MTKAAPVNYVSLEPYSPIQHGVTRVEAAAGRKPAVGSAYREIALLYSEWPSWHRNQFVTVLLPLKRIFALSDEAASIHPVFISAQRRGVFGVIKRELRRRSAIEAVIGHMKTDTVTLAAAISKVVRAMPPTPF